MHITELDKLETYTAFEGEKDQEDTKESREDSTIEVIEVSAKEMPKDAYSSKMLASPHLPSFASLTAAESTLNPSKVSQDTTMGKEGSALELRRAAASGALLAGFRARLLEPFLCLFSKREALEHLLVCVMIPPVIFPRGL